MYGSIAAPKAWSADTTVGEIHGRQVNGTTEFFEAKFNGNAKSKNWYYPENKKDNAWWRVVHPKEYYAITSDWHFGAETTSTPYNTVPSKGNFKKIDAINTLKDKYGDAFRGTIINGDITHWGMVASGLMPRKLLANLMHLTGTGWVIMIMTAM